MRVAFRTDASLTIGSGHVMRCLTLASALHEQGHGCLFICRDYPGHLAQLIRSRGFGLKLLQHPKTDDSNWLGYDWIQDADETSLAIASWQPDWIVVDHYDLDWQWEGVIGDKCTQLMVIDDLADRKHQTDLLLDQNLGRKASDYQHLISASTQLLIGPEYALLRPEFYYWRGYSLKKRKSPRLKRVLITFGGVDVDNATGQVLEQLKNSRLPESVRIDVILSQQAPALQEIKQQVENHPWQITVHENVNNMAELMSHSDLCIGAAGSTCWERACLGLPTLMTSIADNQEHTVATLSELQLCWPFSLHKHDLPEKLNSILENPGTLLSQQSQRLLQTCDGLGTQRVLEYLS